MKKIIISAYMLVAFAGYATAQTTPVKTETKTTTHKSKVKKTGGTDPKTSTSQHTTAIQTDIKSPNGGVSKTGKKVITTTKKKSP